MRTTFKKNLAFICLSVRVNLKNTFRCETPFKTFISASVLIFWKIWGGGGVQGRGRRATVLLCNSMCLSIGDQPNRIQYWVQMVLTCRLFDHRLPIDRMILRNCSDLFCLCSWRSLNFEMSFVDFSFFQKTNENTSHGSKNEFICSVFGRIHGLTVCFRN